MNTGTYPHPQTKQMFFETKSVHMSSLCYTQPMEKPIYPMRINKYLALKKHSTRKAADELITKRKVFINGRTAVLGDKVEENDSVEVRGGGIAKKFFYYAYNKPVGIITHSPQRGEVDIIQATALKGVFPVGRLDKNSHGLVILTNDGHITDRLLNPDYVHEKEYIVKTNKNLRSSFKKNMEAGVKLEDCVTKPCKVSILNENTFKITLTEGRKHQIRRMCVALFNDVIDLQRVRILNIKLNKLGVGSYRAIEGEELKTFLDTLCKN